MINYLNQMKGLSGAQPAPAGPDGFPGLRQAGLSPSITPTPQAGLSGLPAEQQATPNFWEEWKRGLMGLGGTQQPQQLQQPQPQQPFPGAGTQGPISPISAGQHLQPIGAGQPLQNMGAGQSDLYNLLFGGQQSNPQMQQFQPGGYGGQFGGASTPSYGSQSSMPQTPTRGAFGGFSF